MAPVSPRRKREGSGVTCGDADGTAPPSRTLCGDCVSACVQCAPLEGPSKLGRSLVVEREQGRNVWSTVALHRRCELCWECSGS